VAHAAAATGRRLKVTYQANYVPAGGSGRYGIALFRDGGASAIDWVYATPSFDATIAGDPATEIDVHPEHLSATFLVAAPDSSSHTYTVAIVYTSAIPGNLSRRRLMIEEYAA
jgi:hypothetical protein